MNLSYRWLRTLAPTIEASPAQIAERLGMLGAPVDEVIEIGAGLEDVVIARVTEVRQHPDADRLRLCTVEAGGEPLQVVCGAPNVQPGRSYPFAPIGATLPGGIVIRKAKLRGESSEGMLCSARELGLGRDHAGLMTLTGEWEPGASFLDALALRDTRLIVDLTPNRSDLLSHLGLARELAPGGEDDLVFEPFGSGELSLELRPGDREGSIDEVGLRIDDPAGCPRYAAAIVEGVEIGPSPEWLASRLRAIGARPINNVVDATNYVLHELGQPLHAFDLDRLAGAQIIVRGSRPGEAIETLDGIERALEPGTLVIADRDRPVAIAGVMGGAASEVTGTTTRILIECALFSPLRIRKAARGLGLSTDASHRYEREVDPELQPRALRRVVDLIRTIAGGKVVPVALDLRPAPWVRPEVVLRASRVRQLLGVEIPLPEVAALLRPIGFEAEIEAESARVRVPSFRPDVMREIDLIEEIARRWGYDRFEAPLSRFRPGNMQEDPLLKLEGAVHELFARWGFLEARSAAFAPARAARVALLNPLSAEEGHLRDELTEGLLHHVEHNWVHGVRAIRLYELGTIFQAGEGAIPAEEIRLAAALTGPAHPPHWSESTRASDLWDLKGLLEEVARLLGAELEVGGADAGWPDAYDPEESFLLRDGAGVVRGIAGRIAPERIDAPAWADPLWGLEVKLPASWHPAEVRFASLPSFPAIDRDLALIVPAGVPARRIAEVIREAAGGLLEQLAPFDLYQGKALPEGVRSLAWRLRFRHPERTLVDAEVEAVIQQVLHALSEQLDVHRR